MASLKGLVDSNNNGELGKMLAQKFNGECGRTYPRQDADLIIVFESEEKTPSAKDIEGAVTEFYTKLGYQVEKGDCPPDMFEAAVFCGEKVGGAIFVVISTNYPLDGTRNHLRVTTDVTI